MVLELTDVISFQRAMAKLAQSTREKAERWTAPAFVERLHKGYGPDAGFEERRRKIMQERLRRQQFQDERDGTPPLPAPIAGLGSRVPTRCRLLLSAERPSALRFPADEGSCAESVAALDPSLCRVIIAVHSADSRCTWAGSVLASGSAAHARTSRARLRRAC